MKSGWPVAPQKPEWLRGLPKSLAPPRQGAHLAWPLVHLLVALQPAHAVRHPLRCVGCVYGRLRAHPTVSDSGKLAPP